MIRFNAKRMLLTGLTVCGILLLLSFRRTVASAEKTLVGPKDSFQLLVNQYAGLQRGVGSEELPKNHQAQFKAAIERLQHFTASIRGSRSVNLHGVKYLVFVADPDSAEIQLHLYDSSGKSNLLTLGAVKEKLEKEHKKPLMITNAGMYTSSYDPQGLFVERSSTAFFPIDTGSARPNANFYLKPNGVFYIDSLGRPLIDTSEIFYTKDIGKMKMRLATQSGPMLVIGGKIHRSFLYGSTNSKIRSGVGIISGTNKIVFAITMNGTNFYDFALFFRDVFHCDDALFLDGAISQMYLPDLNPKALGGNFGPMISVQRRP
jgi:uncharacterized protein YigE (DUF2233 family)